MIHENRRKIFQSHLIIGQGYPDACKRNHIQRVCTFQTGKRAGILHWNWETSVTLALSYKKCSYFTNFALILCLCLQHTRIQALFKGYMMTAWYWGAFCITRLLLRGVNRFSTGTRPGIRSFDGFGSLVKPMIGEMTLQLRHNGHDGVWNHNPHHCLPNRLFRRRSKKASKLRVTGLCEGNSLGPVNSPHKGPVTRKMFPLDDVIMEFRHRLLSKCVFIFPNDKQTICV